MRSVDIIEFEGLYKITDTGSVIALKRVVRMPNGGVKVIKQHHPKLSETRKGYLKVMLTDKDGKRKGFFVHRLVLLCFVGSSELQAHHKDENKKNNRLSNLEYVTNRVNQIHRMDKSRTSSRYTGVTAKNGQWQAQAMINGKQTYLGLHKTEDEAHLAYLEATT